MALVTVLSTDPEVVRAVSAPLPEDDLVATARSWSRLTWLVRERPASTVVVDSGSLPTDSTVYEAVTDLRRAFPSLAILFVVRPGADPVSLFRLGRAGMRSLVLVPLDSLEVEVRGALRVALSSGTSALVTRAVSACLPYREVAAVRASLDGVVRGWNTEAVAARLGLTRPHLSVRLKAVGLPSAGHLLIWAKLLHAARWLTDPGRSAESVARQLEYSSGSAFRRVLRTSLGVTPTEVVSLGGFRYVLTRFLDDCGLGDSVVFSRAVA